VCLFSANFHVHSIEWLKIRMLREIEINKPISSRHQRYSATGPTAALGVLRTSLIAMFSFCIPTLQEVPADLKARIDVEGEASLRVLKESRWLDIAILYVAWQPSRSSHGEGAARPERSISAARPAAWPAATTFWRHECAYDAKAKPA